MAETPKTEEKKVEPAPAVIMSSPSVKPEDVIIEHEGDPEGKAVDTPAPRKQKEDPLAALRTQMETAERAIKEANERTSAAERERDSARTQVDTVRSNLVKSENEKVIAQELAIQNRVDSAKAELVNAKNAWIEAVDTGKPATIQADLQEKIADATYKLRGAEGAKSHFENWKEKEKNKPAPVATETSSDPYANWSGPAKSWLAAHPRFKSDVRYKRIAMGAAMSAEAEGVKADSDAYFKAINDALKEEGLDDESVVTTSPSPSSRTSSATSTAAPASHDSAGAGASGGTAAHEKRTGSRTFKLDGNMREQAIKTYGKNSTFKLSDDEAYKRYAARQLEIKDKRANGERI